MTWLENRQYGTSGGCLAWGTYAPGLDRMGMYIRENRERVSLPYHLVLALEALFLLIAPVASIYWAIVRAD